MERKLIILDGIIGAGKTKLWNDLKEIYKNRKILFVEEDDYSEITLMGKKYDPLAECYHTENKNDRIVTSQMIIINKSSEKILNALLNEGNYEVIIFDRWHLSCSSFINAKFYNKELSEFTKDFLLNYLEKYDIAISKYSGLKPQNCTVFILDTPLPTSLERISKRERKQEMGVSEDYWCALNTALRESYNNYDRRFNYIFLDTQEKIKNKIEEILQHK